MDKYDLLEFCGIPKRPLCHVREFYSGKVSELDQNFKPDQIHSALLYGAVGSGKTTMACEILAHSLFQKGQTWIDWELKKFDRKSCSDTGEKNGRPVPIFHENYQPEYPYLFIKLLDLFSMIKQTFGCSGGSEQDILHKYIGCELLVLDDLGVEMTTPWNYQILYQLIDSRYDAFKPTIYTSNYSISELAKKIGDNRIISRIIGDCTKDRIIEIRNPDWRVNGRVH